MSVLEIRLNEHLDINKDTAIGDHIVKAKHKIELKNFKIVKSEPSYWHRKYKEAMLIKCEGPSMNRDGGLELPSIYDDLLTRSSRDRVSPDHVTSV